jgi:hypothetical protein
MCKDEDLMRLARRIEVDDARYWESLIVRMEVFLGKPYHYYEHANPDRAIASPSLAVVAAQSVIGQRPTLRRDYLM